MVGASATRLRLANALRKLACRDDSTGSVCDNPRNLRFQGMTGRTKVKSPAGRMPARSERRHCGPCLSGGYDIGRRTLLTRDSEIRAALVARSRSSAAVFRRGAVQRLDSVTAGRSVAAESAGSRVEAGPAVFA